jgi:glycosyltransferase involved in cell wall biosynthesis
MITRARAPISAYVICFNEEERIRKCLESLAWCDEIIIVDSGSIDSTVEICREFTDKIFFNEWSGYGNQKNFALSKCSHSWVLNLDADEVVSEELKLAIQGVLEEPRAETADGYLLQRVVFHLGHWWTVGGWHPEYRLRLAKRDCVQWSNDPVHEKAILSGRKRKLIGSLYHYTYRNLEDQLARINKYSTLSAQQLATEPAISPTALLTCLLTRPLFRFIRFYFLKFGFVYGVAGLIVAITDSYYVFLKYAKLWELSQKAVSEESKVKLLTESAPLGSHISEKS